MVSTMKISALRDIYHSDLERLSELGIEDHDDLLEHAGDPAARAALMRSTGISHPKLLKWASRADIARIEGICDGFALLLENVGIDTVPELAERTAAELYPKLAAVNTRKEVMKKLPDQPKLNAWINYAMKLRRKIYY